MAVSPILNNAMIQRTDDVGVLKHQQDVKPAIEQQNAMTQVEKKTEESRRQVTTKDDTDKTDTHADAREEGKNTYFSQKKSRKDAQPKKTEDRVIKKTMGGGFDIKV